MDDNLSTRITIIQLKKKDLIGNEDFIREMVGTLKMKAKELDKLVKNSIFSEEVLDRDVKFLNGKIRKLVSPFSDWLYRTQIKWQ